MLAVTPGLSTAPLMAETMFDRVSLLESMTMFEVLLPTEMLRVPKPTAESALATGAAEVRVCGVARFCTASE